MSRTNIEAHNGIWHWYRNISECYYHIQITVKYRKPLLDEDVQKIMLMTLSGFKERYALDIHTVGFDQNHVHLLCRFLPKYSGGQVVSIIKSITASHIFKFVPIHCSNLYLPALPFFAAHTTYIQAHSIPFLRWGLIVPYLAFI